MLDELDKQALKNFLEAKDDTSKDVIATKYKIDTLAKKIDVIFDKVNKIEAILMNMNRNSANDPVSRFMREHYRPY